MGCDDELFHLLVGEDGRPKVIYNSTTGTFVMGIHKENGGDYSESRAAVSDTVDYDFQRSFRTTRDARRVVTHPIAMNLKIFS